ncbi:MAG: ABC transporter substrate-binding protein [Chloroflexota bacterium]|nr:ABC transporter substrate-binding protein [Chloroflexota bacterium]
MKTVRLFVLLSLVAMLGALAIAPAAAQDDMSEFVFAHSGPIRPMDPHSHWYGSTHWMLNLYYDCLIWRAADGNGYVPQAAQSWEAIDDTTWRFHLREGATFHNGEPLDAAAVKWNIDRVRHPVGDIPLYQQWDFVQEVVVVDELTVDILTPQPHAFVEWDVSYNGCELIPPAYFEEVGQEEFNRNPVGSGPYKLVELSENDRYVFEAWDDYHSGRPEVDRVVYQVIPEPSAQVAALLAGQIDMMIGVPVPDRERLEATDGISLVNESSNIMHHYYARVDTDSGAFPETFPEYEPATLDINVRKAITHAFDRHLLAEVHGAAEPRLARVCAHYPEGYADKYADPDIIADWYNPELAKEYLAAAGYAEGEGPTLYLDTPVVGRGGGAKEVAEVAAAMLEDVGFTVDLTVRDASAFAVEVQRSGNNRDLMLATLGCSYAGVTRYYQCDWSAVAYNICNEEWDAVADAIQVTIDTDERLALWEQWWEFYIDYSQTITLFEVTNVMALNTADFAYAPRKDGWMTFRDVQVADM